MASSNSGRRTRQTDTARPTQAHLRPSAKQQSQQGRRIALGILCAVVLVAIGVGAFFYLRNADLFTGGSQQEGLQQEPEGTEATQEPGGAEEQGAEEQGSQEAEPDQQEPEQSSAEDLPTIRDEVSAEQSAGEITIGIYGSENTFVLVGEEYLEAGAYASEPTDGILNDQILIAGEVNTQVPGDYTVTYTVADSQGYIATARRVVHVVESMDTQQDGIPVLMYHYVYTAENPPEDLNNNYLLDTDLEAQLQYLVENGYYYPSFQEVKAFLEGTHSLPAKSVVLTFDDGEAGFLEYGIALLEKYGVHATSFLVCNDFDAIDKVVNNASPYVSFQSHSYAMHQAGGTIGHGGIISAMTKDEILADLTLAQEICGATQAFAYPYGDVTDDGQTAVAEAGILCAFTTENRWCAIGDDLTILPRVRISAGYSLDGFAYLVSTFN